MQGINHERLEKLRELSKAMLPGDFWAIIGFLPLAIIVPTVLLALTSSEPRKTTGGSFETPTSPWIVAGYLSITAVAVAGTVSLIIVRIVLNGTYIHQNKICLSYPLAGEAKHRYHRLLQALEALKEADAFRIAERGPGDYERVTAASFRRELPSLLAADCDVYCLAAGKDRYYLLPDCVLMFVGKQYHAISWRNLLLNTRNIAGRLSVIKYRTVLVHGRIRKDGGYDERYNTRTYRQRYRGWDDISQHGVLSFSFAKEEVTILTTRRDLVRRFENAFREWTAI